LFPFFTETKAMFKRVILEEWASIVPMVAFGILFLVFFATTIRAVFMRPADRERMAKLPLQDASEEP
jgi:hypothetical protein